MFCGGVNHMIFYELGKSLGLQIAAVLDILKLIDFCSLEHSFDFLFYFCQQFRTGLANYKQT